MALAIDSQEASATGHRITAASPLTWTFTNTAGNLLLVGVVTTNGTLTTAITSISYGGDALTALGTGQNTDGTRTFIQWWYKTNPKTGSNTVSIVWTGTGGTAAAALAGAISFSGADTTTPLGSEVKATGTGTAVDSGAVSSTSGNIVVSVGASGTSGTYTPTSPDATTYSLSGSNNTAGDNLWASTFSSSGASHNMKWTIPSDTWGIVGVEVRASSATVAIDRPRGDQRPFPFAPSGAGLH
jgi:hypothetical protein